MHHIKVIKDGNVNNVVKEQLVDGVQYVDDEPREGSLNGITSDAVAKVAGDVGDVKDVIPEGTTEENPLVNETGLGEVAERVTMAEGDIDAIEGKIPSGASSSNKLVTKSDLKAAQDSWQSGFTPKGEATVSQIDALTTQSNGDQYIVTDSGTITAGSVAVVAGDTVAWNATDEVWYKVNQYATTNYAQNVAKSIAPEFDPTQNYVVGDSCNYEGAAYIFTSDHPAGAWNPAHATTSGQNALLRLTAQNTLAKILPAFDPNKTVNPDTGFAYIAGESVIYNGEIKMFVNEHTGAWVDADAITINLPQKFATSEVMQRLLGNRLDDSQFTRPGYFIDGSGSWISSANFGDSGRCPCIPGEYLSFYTENATEPNRLNNHIAFYDVDGNFLSVTGSSPTHVRRVRVPNNAFWFSMPIKWSDGFSAVNTTAAGFVPSYFIPYASCNKKTKSVVDSAYVPNNLFDKDAVTYGGYIQSIVDGEEQWVSNSNYCESDFIDVRSRSVFYFDESRNIPNSWPYVTITLYDENKNPLRTVSVGYTSPEVFPYITADTAYIRVPINKANIDAVVISNEKITRYVPFGYRPKVLFDIDVAKTLGDSDKKAISQNAVTQALAAIIPSGSQWYGKKWYAYGTSITDTNTTGKYLPYLEQMSGMIATDNGIGGGGIGDLGAYSSGQVFNAVCNITDGKLEADLITLETGANDTGADVPLGTIYDTTQDTLAGCLNICLRYLQANTNAQIAVMPSVATTREPQDANQYYKWQFMIEQICVINRVYFIRPACNLGYGKLTSLNGNLYVVDNIHQTDLGGYILAEAMWKQIKEIPLFRTALPT